MADLVQAAQTHAHIPPRSRAEVVFFKFDRGSDGPKRDIVLALSPSASFKVPGRPLPV